MSTYMSTHKGTRESLDSALWTQFLCLLLLSASKSVDTNAVLDKTMQRGVLMTDKNTIPYSDIPDELIDSWYEELESEEEEDYPTDEEIAEIMSELYKDEQ